MLAVHERMPAGTHGANGQRRVRRDQRTVLLLVDQNNLPGYGKRVPIRFVVWHAKAEEEREDDKQGCKETFVQEIQLTSLSLDTRCAICGDNISGPLADPVFPTGSISGPPRVSLMSLKQVKPGNRLATIALFQSPAYACWLLGAFPFSIRVSRRVLYSPALRSEQNHLTVRQRLGRPYYPHGPSHCVTLA